MVATVTKLVPKAPRRLKTISFLVEGEATKITVTPELHARFEELFKREIPSDLQKRRMAALKRLMAAAYIAGRDAPG